MAQVKTSLHGLCPSCLQAVAFSSGLATTLATLGLVSSSLGRAYGQIGDGLPIAVSALAIVMGLNLLEVCQCKSVTNRV